MGWFAGIGWLVGWLAGPGLFGPVLPGGVRCRGSAAGGWASCGVPAGTWWMGAEEPGALFFPRRWAGKLSAATGGGGPRPWRGGVPRRRGAGRAFAPVVNTASTIIIVF